MQNFLLLILLLGGSLQSYAQCWRKAAASKSSSFGSHTLVIATDGSLWSFGANSSGQLGDGTTTNKSTPTQIGGDKDWVDVIAFNGGSIGIKSDGTLWSWGLNDYYALGDGTNISHSVPQKVGTDTNWKSVSCQLHAVVAVKTDGTLWRWGTDTNSGGGTFASPTQIGTDTDWVEVVRGASQTMAIKSNGTRWVYGATFYGALGDGSEISNLSSLTQADTGLWTSLSSGIHSLGIQLDGSIWGWGANQAGQVGIGVNSSSINSPVLIDNSHDWKMVSTGNNVDTRSEFSLAIRDDNTLWAWGGGQSYVTGTGTTSNLPIQVGTGTDWISISAGGNHSAGIRSGNTLWTWGVALDGQLGTAVSGNTSPVPVQVGCPVALPVVLINFTVAVEENTSTLHWTTTSETNADRFEIQRSKDARTWYVIGEKKAIGFQASRRDYVFTDSSPLDGKNYYRLKMIDLDNTFAYSKIQHATVGAPSAVLYPNPVSDYLFINGSGLVEKVELIDVNGQVVAEHRLFPMSGINVKSLLAGLYLVRVTEQNGNIQRHKIVVKR